MAMRAAVLAIGDELVLGQVAERHAQVVSASLLDAGFTTHEHRTVPDDLEAIVAALRELARSSDLLIVTGGLGPTDDDLTRQALARALGGERLVEDDDARSALLRRFQHRGAVMPQLNLRQTLRPESARTLPNPHGTAPGLAVLLGTTRVYCLPGPPNEMEPMLRGHVLPELVASAPRGAGSEVRTMAVHTCGLAEAEVAQRLGALMDRNANPLVGTTASAALVSARVRAWGSATTDGSFESVTDEVRRRLAPFVYGDGTATLAGAVGALLLARGERLALAESCTGGLVGELLTSVAGSSRWFAGGWIVYSNELKKSQLNVSEATLAGEGAVSAACAREMAIGAAQSAETRWGVSITGIAGPDGGSAEKPVGTVWVGLVDRKAEQLAQARHFRIQGDREGVRTRAARLALQWLHMELVDAPRTRLLWEVVET
jgi:nicotinamide-nucleotide amidase